MTRPVIARASLFGVQSERRIEARRAIERIGGDIPVVEALGDRFERERKALLVRRRRKLVTHQRYTRNHKEPASLGRFCIADVSPGGVFRIVCIAGSAIGRRDTDDTKNRLLRHLGDTRGS